MTFSMIKPCIGPNKRMPVYRVTQPYLNLVVKPRIFSGFLEKYIILCILKREMSFKMHKIIYIFPKYNLMHFERQNAFQNA